MTRKLAFAALLLAALILSFAGLAQAAPAHEVVFKVGRGYYVTDGQQNWMDAAAFIQDGRTYVPVRYLAYALGVNENDVKYDNGTVTLALNGKTLTMAEGSKALKVDNTNTPMDVAPVIKEGRTYLPARWVAEAFGYKVDWFEPIQWVMIRDAATWKAAQPKFLNGPVVNGHQYANITAVAFGPQSNKITAFNGDPIGMELAEKQHRTDINPPYAKWDVTLPGPVWVNSPTGDWRDIQVSIKNLLLAFGVPEGAIHWDEETQTMLVECDYIYRVDSPLQDRFTVQYIWMRPGENVFYEHFTDIPDQVRHIEYSSEDDYGKYGPEAPGARFIYDSKHGMIGTGLAMYLPAYVYHNEMNGLGVRAYEWHGLWVVSIG
ncbi:Copper amine oxidase-like, N-terminal [Moorella glycerini]|uniref:Copper amine oxidase-like N-terminal domain-containing protein n=1 Tax=Neomoorella stamsii TaxID=1266720 RepID=A0A9X7J5W0_9FIRM|nr:MULTISPECIES: copper amine oxidase N-terminal domain-containing protein [Moorella]PRR76282.1 hypothetical protein MOST_04430 [Moorella stamsii]CEP67150.1 Copper amine oxidase-like, N-terminal [Moorella glycerini]